jgi:O-antigen/teichoic acid export membrane protein
MKHFLKDIVSTNQSQGLRFFLIKSTSATFLLKIIFTGLGFITHVLLARLLGAANYGSYAYIMAWIGLLAIPATLGFNQLLIREIAIYRVRENWENMQGLLRFSNRLILWFSITLVLTAVGISGLLFDLADDLSIYNFWIALLMLPLISLNQLRSAALLGMNRIILSQLPEMLIGPFSFIVLIGGAYLLFYQDLSVSLILFFKLISFSIVFGFGAYWLHHIIPQAVKIAKPNIEQHSLVWFKSALPFLFISGMHIINTSTDTIMLGAIKGAEAAGIYTVANQGASLVVFTLAAANTALAPIIAQLYAAGEREKLQRIITKGVRMTFLVSLPFALGFVILGDQFLLIFGEDFVVGYAALSILVLGQLINVGMGSVGILLNMTGFPRDVAIAVTISAVLNVILNALFIPKWGIAGAAFATSMTLVIWNTLLAFKVYKRLGIHSTIFGKMNFGVTT